MLKYTSKKYKMKQNDNIFQLNTQFIAEIK